MDLAHITARFHDQYIRNNDATSFITRCNRCIQLDQFTCFTYGHTSPDTPRSLIMLRFEGFNSNTPTGRPHYKIQIFNGGEWQDSFWVNDMQKLRNKILNFTGAMNFLRVFFVYDPITNDIYRLQFLRPYLFLPNLVVEKEAPIYTSSQDYIRYAYPLEASPECTQLFPDESPKQILDLQFQKIHEILSTDHNYNSKTPEEKRAIFIQYCDEAFSRFSSKK